MKALISKALLMHGKIADIFQCVSLLVFRLAMGILFVQAGWGKLQNLDKVVEFFKSLGIPAPQLQAPFVATVEFGGGILLLLGLFTRIVSLPLMGVMVVALITAKKDDIADISSLLGTTDFLYLLILFGLSTLGAGNISVDGFFSRKKK
jgi:putative oxidoreductase